jgi:hypothetical protein
MRITSSNETKQKYNNKHHTQVKVSVEQEIALAFKAKCIAGGILIAGEISSFMSAVVSNVVLQKPQTDAVATRGQRRNAVEKLIWRIEAVLDAESAYLENIPENLSGPRFYEASERTVAAPEDVLNFLAEAY